MVYGIGYNETIANLGDWITNNNLTYTVLADLDGSVSESYSGFFGGPAVTPWTAIVGVDRILYFSEDAYSSAGDSLHMSDILAVFDSLFAPEISPDPSSLDFGQVSIGESADLEISLDNSGTGLLEITDITSSSSAFSATPTQGEIYAVDDELVVTVTFTPEVEGTYDETLTVVSPVGNLEIPVTGIGSSVGVEPEEITLPQAFEISCYPNPFNPELTIWINLDNSQDVRVELYDVQGAKQDEVWQGWLRKGIHTLKWDAQNTPSGLYFLKISGGDRSEVVKVVLAR